MSPINTNLAVTVDGEPYNKLRRPDQFPSPPPAILADKRKRAVDDVEDPGRNDRAHNKRPRASGVSQGVSRSRGHRQIRDAPGRLPVSDGEGSSDDEITVQARAFLRGAREEERTLNQALLLVDAPAEMQDSDSDASAHNESRSTACAHYQHGYYFARDVPLQGDVQEESSEVQPQAQYYKMLLKRYAALRKTLADNAANADQLAKRMQEEPSKCTNANPPKNRLEWRYTLNRDYPTPAKAWQLDEHDVCRGLKYCAYDMDRSDSISKQNSCWIWTLLAKAGELDTMLSEKVSPIRDLALKAGQLGIRIRGAAIQDVGADYDDEDAEDWHVDDVEPEYEGSEHSSDEDAGILEGNTELPVVDIIQAEADVALPNMEVTPSRQHNKLPDPDPKDEDDADSGADMSMSEEGEVQDDAEPEPATLEEARARLLAQLGDRLVQPQADTDLQAQKVGKDRAQESARNGGPQSRQSRSSLSPSPPRAARHRHNGKICHNPSCALEERRRVSHKKAGLRAAQSSASRHDKYSLPRERPFGSRAEAEAQRQAMREEDLVQAQLRKYVESSKTAAPLEQAMHVTTKFTNENLAPSEKVLSSCSEVEGYPKQQLERLQSKQGQKATSQEDVAMTEVDIPDLNTRVTIDMILTVAIECYGQRDLLKYRDSWS
ncbi:hypothetical protein K504DRAFT_467716 [Pleomassaria siparia CBS 279.74]|uniref:Uncharacterized protein n=1 Tax=Pleomassaria siparia CBS 279.74 TaxID=1314801 RepID=A0A6G1KA72_9PLEO|nr:hypothetical protein K504DRAFT_467716 [Pleomassaria siparia CBS 279.74]